MAKFGEGHPCQREENFSNNCIIYPKAFHSSWEEGKLIVSLIAFFPWLLCFQKWKCHLVKVKYNFVLYTSLSFAQIGNQKNGIRMKIVWILHDFRIFSLGKGPFTGRTLGKARKIPALPLRDYHLILEYEWNALQGVCYIMIVGLMIVDRICS